MSGKSHNPLFWSNANTALSTGVADFSQQIWIPGGMKLGIFVVGGGGGADDSYSGSSGFFKYEELTVETSGFYNISVELGNGGDYSDGGDTTFDIVGVTSVTAKMKGMEVEKLCQLFARHSSHWRQERLVTMTAMEQGVVESSSTVPSQRSDSGGMERDLELVVEKTTMMAMRVLLSLWSAKNHMFTVSADDQLHSIINKYAIGLI